MITSLLESHGQVSALGLHPFALLFVDYREIFTCLWGFYGNNQLSEENKFVLRVGGALNFYSWRAVLKISAQGGQSSKFLLRAGSAQILCQTSPITTHSSLQIAKR